jgi:anti-anti-sigma factor
MVSQSTRRWLEIEHIGDVTVAKFNTRRLLSEEKMQAVSDQLFCLGEEAGYGSLVLNFASVERLSTEMLGTLMALQRKVQAKGGKLALCKLKPELHELLKKLKLQQFLTIYSDEQEALQRA